MLVTIIGSKICYGHSRAELSDYIADIWNHDQNRFHGCMVNQLSTVLMSDSQFVRFKNAGRRHAGGLGKFSGFEDRDRPDRTGDAALHKWDVDSYGQLVGRQAGWGSGAATNRDHVTADSSNQLRLQQGGWAGAAQTRGGVKSEALAMAVSGEHHRLASWTYGGRTKTIVPQTGQTRTEFGATDPTASFLLETEAMLRYKSSHIKSSVAKNTLRIEMVGAYVFLYIQSVKQGHVAASIAQDSALIGYLANAVANDDGRSRT